MGTDFYGGRPGTPGFDTDRAGIAPGAVLAKHLMTGLVPSVVTSLPTRALFPGYRALYAADAANGVYWELVYTGLGTYPWQIVGGPPLWTGDSSAVAGTTTGAAYGGLTGLGDLNLTTPLAGDYMIEHGATMWQGTAANNVSFQSFAVGGTGASDTDSIEHSPGSAANTDQHQTSSVLRRKTGIAAGSLIDLRWRVSGGGTAAFRQRYLALRPIRVG